MKARVRVSLKTGVLDPQGKAIEHALGNLGFDGVKEVRQGKFFDVILEETDASKANEKLTEMCEKLLVNPVVENYEIEQA